MAENEIAPASPEGTHSPFQLRQENITPLDFNGAVASSDASSVVAPVVPPPATKTPKNVFGLPSRLCSLEFIVCVLVISGIMISLHVSMFIRSRRHLENWMPGTEMVERGWILGLPRDGSDDQWKGFAQHFHFLALGFFAFPLLSRLVRIGCAKMVEGGVIRSPSTSSESHGFGDSKTPIRIHCIFYVLVGFVFLLYLFGADALMLLSCALVNFAIGRIFRTSRWNPGLSWGFSAIVLFFPDHINPFHSFPIFRSILGAGVLNWDTYYNVCMLRFVSFNVDYRSRLRGKPTAVLLLGKSGRQTRNSELPVESQLRAPPSVHLGETLSAKDYKTYDIYRKECLNAMKLRNYDSIESHMRIDFYTILPYLTYVIYIPLLLGGPIIGFDEFFSQIVANSSVYCPYNRDFVRFFTRRGSHLPVTTATVSTAVNPPSDKPRYIPRPVAPFTFWTLVSNTLFLLLYIFVLELMLHISYYYAMSISDAWMLMPPWEILSTALITLEFMFLKFLIIWRLFRLWALLDGVDTVANMNRCIFNGWTFAGFWRSWHRSLNQWIFKYIYVPLGGSKTQLISVWVIFVFIGMWHDRSLVWLAWSFSNCLFFSNEIVLQGLFKKRKFFRTHLRSSNKRYIHAIFGSVNLMLISLANISITFGFRRSWIFLRLGFLRSVFPLPVSYIYFFCLIMTMVEYREHEIRNGVLKDF